MPTPPKTSAVLSVVLAAYALRFSSICAANSRVGARIKARTCLGVRFLGAASIAVRMGSENAAVFPVPVWAAAKTSRPFKSSGIAFT